LRVIQIIFYKNESPTERFNLRTVNSTT